MTMPNPTDPPPNVPDDDPDFSPKQLSALSAAVQAQVKRLLRDVPSKKDFEALATSLAEKLMPPKPEPDPSKKTEDEELQKLRKRLEEMERRNQEAEQRAVEAERHARLDKAESQIAKLLSGGADPKLRVKEDYLQVLAQHFLGKVTLTPDGKALLKVRRSPAKGLPPEDMEVEISDGIAGWLRSDEAHAWMPAPTGQGGGMKAPSAARPPVAAPGPPIVKAPSRPADSLDDAIARTEQQLGEMGIDASRL
jgi:hypothetical protein